MNTTNDLTARITRVDENTGTEIVDRGLTLTL